MEALIEKVGHVVEGEPDGLVCDADFEACAAVLGLVEQELGWAEKSSPQRAQRTLRMH